MTQVLDSLAEACESISDVDGSQQYKRDADRMAATFYGASDVSKLYARDRSTMSPRNPASPTEATLRRDPAASRRRSFGAPSSSTEAGADAGVSETAIRDGVATVISRLGLGHPGTADDAEDTLSIYQAERDLHDTFAKTGGADAIGLSSPSTPARPHAPSSVS